MHPRDLLPDELWREIAYHMPFVCFLRGSHRYLRQLIDEDPELWIVDRLSNPMLRDFSEEFRKVAHLKALDGRRGSCMATPDDDLSLSGGRLGISLFARAEYAEDCPSAPVVADPQLRLGAAPESLLLRTRARLDESSR